MIRPSLAEVEKLTSEGKTVPISMDLLADVETPVSAYIKLGGGRGSFLLESVEGGERLGRYSFIGVAPDSTVRFERGRAVVSGDAGDETVLFDDPLRLIDGILAKTDMARLPGLPRFHGGAVGYLSYDVSAYFERLPSLRGPGLGLPLGVLGVYRTVVAFDHLRRTMQLITQVSPDGDVRKNYDRAVATLRDLAARLSGPARSAIRSGDSEKSVHAGTARSAPSSSPNGFANGSKGPNFTSNFTRPDFEEAVRRAKRYIAAGDAIQVVLSQRISVACAASPFTLYRVLRSINPSPYMYFLDNGDFQIVGSSPEMLVRVEDSVVSVHPIAGTRGRGQDPAEDEDRATELAGDEKERAEHLMLVDLGRNDVGRVSAVGSVRVSQLLEVERYSHVMHLVSHVEGRLTDGLRPVDALRSGFPAGTVSGAPKVRAMEIIAELEPDARGPYSGAVGYLGFDGSLDTAIAIRTAVVVNGTVHVQAGAGIVADSVPALEYEETLRKAAAMLKAVEEAERMEAPATAIAGRK